MLYDPSQTPPNDVRGQPLGKTVWAEAVADHAGDPVLGCPVESANCQFFPETNHTLSEPFASFWQQWDGETLFGPPVSEPFTDPADPGAQMQVFESAILENRGGIVSLRPTGRFLAERDGVLGDAGLSAGTADRRQLISDQSLRRATPARRAKSRCRDGGRLARQHRVHRRGRVER